MFLFEKYFLKKTFRNFFLFFFMLSFLFLLIDYAEGLGGKIEGFLPKILYFSSLLGKKGILLILLSFTLSLLKTFSTIRENNEWIALLTCGLSGKTIFRPFFLISLLFFSFFVLFYEYIEPLSQTHLRLIEENILNKKQTIMSSKDSSKGAHFIALENGNSLLFENYLPKEKKFTDVFLPQKNGDLFRMKYLKENPHATGFFLEIFKKGENGLELVSSSPSETIQDFTFKKISQKKQGDFIEEKPLSFLFKASLPLFYKTSLTEKEAITLSLFLYRFSLLFFPFFALCITAPFFFHFDRHMKDFIAYGISLFSMVFLISVFNAALLLAKRQVYLPQIILGVPFLVCFFGLSFYLFKTLDFSYKKIKTKKRSSK